jgi:hypothetical protein
MGAHLSDSMTQNCLIHLTWITYLRFRAVNHHGGWSVTSDSLVFTTRRVFDEFSQGKPRPKSETGRAWTLENAIVYLENAYSRHSKIIRGRSRVPVRGVMDQSIYDIRIIIIVLLGFSKIKYVPKIMKLIHIGVFPRRRASPRAARAPTRCGVDQTFDLARFRLGWSCNALSEPHRVRPLE